MAEIVTSKVTFGHKYIYTALIAYKKNYKRFLQILESSLTLFNKKFFIIKPHVKQKAKSRKLANI